MKSILQKSMTLVCNFVSGGDAHKNSWAKVRWDSTILLNIHGGIKIFNLYAHASTLLVKMITLRLEPGLEPWKVFL